MHSFPIILTAVCLVTTLRAATVAPGGAVLFSGGVSAAVRAPTSSAWSDFDKQANGHAAFAAARFSLAQDATVERINFEGRYTNDGVFLATDHFFIAILSNFGGLPGAALLPSTSVGLLTREVVGRGMSGTYTVDYLKYTVSLNSPVWLAAGDYWLGLANDTSASGSPNEWTWHSSGVASGFRAFSRTSQITGYGGPYAADMVFSLQGTPVPEPSGGWLLVVAFCFLGSHRRVEC